LSFQDDTPVPFAGAVPVFNGSAPSYQTCKPLIEVALNEIGVVILVDAADTGDVPAGFVAVTVNVYDVPLVKPLTTIGSEAPVPVMEPGLLVTV
jgi:hypothetical protein